MAERHGMRRYSELSEWKLEDKNKDVRGDPVLDAAGRELTRVDDMMVDLDERRVATLIGKDGRSYPVEEVELRDGAVIVRGGDRPGETRVETGSSKVQMYAWGVRPPDAV